MDLQLYESGKNKTKLQGLQKLTAEMAMKCVNKESSPINLNTVRGN